MPGIEIVVLQKFGQMPPEPACVPLIRRVGGNIELGKLAELGIAHIGVELLVVLGENFGEARDIGVAVDAEQRFAPLFVAFIQLAKDRVVAGKDAVLKTFLELPE